MPHPPECDQCRLIGPVAPAVRLGRSGFAALGHAGQPSWPVLLTSTSSIGWANGTLAVVRLVAGWDYSQRVGPPA